MVIQNYPLLFLVLSFFFFALSAKLGSLYRKRRHPEEHDMGEDFGVVVGATLTLLALIIGFTLRSGQYEKKGSQMRKRGKYQAKEEDMLCLPLILEAISIWPSNYVWHIKWGEGPCHKGCQKRSHANRFARIHL